MSTEQKQFDRHCKDCYWEGVCGYEARQENCCQLTYADGLAMYGKAKSPLE